jgi:hypothetical protein
LIGNLRRTKSYLSEIDNTIGEFSNKDFEDFNWTAQSAYKYEIALTPEKSLTPITNIHLEEIIHSMNKSPLPKKSDSSLDSNTDLIGKNTDKTNKNIP